ncbi:hypothetical protein HMPREF9120_01375 [Neisseria sp. oral taxon 020 str. F0370]|nr:hypothetical protein HMPREF9120_01375 [Neisseria sp. oral taxon 020 str. F0370]
MEILQKIKPCGRQVLTAETVRTPKKPALRRAERGLYGNRRPPARFFVRLSEAV